MRGFIYFVTGTVRVGIILGIMHLIQVLLLKSTEHPNATMIQIVALFLLAVGAYARLLMLANEYTGV